MTELDFKLKCTYSTMKTCMDGNNNLQLRRIPASTVHYSVLKWFGCIVISNSCRAEPNTAKAV